MKITVDISEFYLDEEQNLEEGLRQYIKREVFSEINKSIKEKVENQITMQVKDTVEKLLYASITSAIKDAVATEKVPSRKDSKVSVTIQEYVRECVLYNTGGWQGFDETIKRIATELGKEVKARYDLLFASQIVNKLSDNGLLKEDVAKLLLSPSNQ